MIGDGEKRRARAPFLAITDLVYGASSAERDSKKRKDAP